MTGIVARDLEALRDHARAMAAMTEPKISRRPEWFENAAGYPDVRTRTIVVTPMPTPAEQALWVQIADEIDAYLAPDDGEPLW